MTIEDAIKHCWDVIGDDNACEKCKEEHFQLYNWLTELVNRRENDKKQNQFADSDKKV
jgi:hypothetical protein